MMTRRRLLIGTAVGFAGASMTQAWVAPADGETSRSRTGMLNGASS
jgi:hypothetical protein